MLICISKIPVNLGLKWKDFEFQSKVVNSSQFPKSTFNSNESFSASYISGNTYVLCSLTISIYAKTSSLNLGALFSGKIYGITNVVLN